MIKIREKYPDYRFFVFSILLTSCLVLISGISPADQRVRVTPVEPVWLNWPTVGTATLRWGFWNIYDARLQTPDGQYDADNPYARDLALVIDYRRDISKSGLLSATDKQWRHLGVASPQRGQWIKKLGEIWHGVRKGDRLVYVLTAGNGRFYFGDKFLGQVDDMLLARSFMDIWLSERTAYPDLRRRLIGLR